MKCILNLKDSLYPLLGSELHRNSCCHIELSSQGWIRRCLAVSQADSYARLLIEINLGSRRKNPTMPIGLCLRTLPFPLIKCCRSVLTHFNCSVAMFNQLLAFLPLSLSVSLQFKSSLSLSTSTNVCLSVTFEPPGCNV